MQKLVAIQDFGTTKRGETVEVPDDADFAKGYFAKADETEIEVPPNASPVAEGLSDAPEANNEAEKEEG